MSNRITEPDLSQLWQFCAHEHWGAIGSIGMSDEGFRADTERGALPDRRTGLIDILLDPYFSGCLAWSGVNPDEIARQHGAESMSDLAQTSVVRALEVLRPALRQQRLTGTYQCIRRGLQALYGLNLEGDEREVIALDSSIAASYERIFDWYRECMGKAGFTVLVRPVHPIYYVREESAQTAEQETVFTYTVMRIDPLLDLWPKECREREALATVTGVEPVDAKSWGEFIGQVFDLAEKNGALGIKQLQAYRRTLESEPVGEEDVKWSGNLTPGQVKVFQDWVLHECCKQANDRGWPQQVHVGTHNLPESSPMPLLDLANRYPRMKLVMLHCWPFINESAWLAKHHPNIYIDACWLPILSPQLFRQALDTWLNYIPYHKLMISNDATSVEMAVGSSLFVREILSEALARNTRDLGIAPNELRQIGAGILHDNAAVVYEIRG